MDGWLRRDSEEPRCSHKSRGYVQPKRCGCVQQTTCPGSSAATRLRPATGSRCSSAARATPPSPSSLPSTAAARPCCVPPPSGPEAASAAARRRPLYRCVLCGPCLRLRARALTELLLAVQKLLAECQSHRECQLPVHHLLFGRDPCPGSAKYLHVDYKCKPSES